MTRRLRSPGKGTSGASPHLTPSWSMTLRIQRHVQPDLLHLGGRIWVIPGLRTVVWQPSSGNGTGSTVGNVSAPFAEQTIVHNGKQSMPLAYDNTSGKGYSEAVRTLRSVAGLDAGRREDPGAVLPRCLGQRAGQLYVKINGTRVDYTGNAAAVTTALWKQWNIDLAVGWRPAGGQDAGYRRIRLRQGYAVHRRHPAVPGGTCRGRGGIGRVSGGRRAGVQPSGSSAWRSPSRRSPTTGGKSRNGLNIRGWRS